MYTLYMALHINNPAVEENVRRMATLTGESITDAIGYAVKERIDRIRGTALLCSDPTVEEVLALVRSFHLEPISRELTEDEILGYGPDGYCA